MAYTFVQTKKAVVGASATFTSTPTVNNLIVVGFTVFSATQPVLVTDNQGNTYTRVAQAHDTAGGNWATIFATIATTSSGTFTVSTTQGDGTMIINEFSGNKTSSYIGAVNNGNGSGSTQPKISLTTTGSGSLIVGVEFDENDGGTQVPITGLTLINNETNNTTNERQAFMDRISDAGTYNIGLSSGYSGSWAVAAAEFFAPSSTSVKMQVMKGWSFPI